MSALQNKARVPPTVEDTAADWVARRNGGLNLPEEAELQKWLLADPGHATAFEKCQHAWETIARPRHAGLAVPALRELNARQHRRVRRRLAGLGMAAAILLLTAVFSFRTSLVSHFPDAPAATIAVRPEMRILPDGSTAEFNAGAEIVVEYSPVGRRVRLIRGEVLFSVVRDATRVFSVVTHGVVVEAVGTAFAVRCDSNKIGVLVTQGLVAVTRAAEDGATTPAPVVEAIYLNAGKELELPAATLAPAAPSIKPLSPSEIAAALAWRGKRVEFSGTSLPDALAWFNRHNRVQLLLTDPRLENRRISGIFWGDNPEAFVRLLETGLGLAAERDGESIKLRMP